MNVRAAMFNHLPRDERVSGKKRERKCKREGDGKETNVVLDLYFSAIRF